MWADACAGGGEVIIMFLDKYVKACQTIQFMFNSTLYDSVDLRHIGCDSVKFSCEGKMYIHISGKMSADDVEGVEELFYDNLLSSENGVEPRFEVLLEEEEEEL